ncbi:MAG: SRPBCC family protein [Bacteroidota bacterium]
MKLEFEKKINLDVPATKAWDILWQNYENVGQWATIIPESTARKENGKTKGRVCTSSYGNVKEWVTHQDSKNMNFSYEADGLPSMFKYGKNNWKIASISENRSTVTMQLSMKMTKIHGFLLGWMIKNKMNKDLENLMEDLKHFAETDNIHPRKMKSLQKWNRRRLKKSD